MCRAHNVSERPAESEGLGGVGHKQAGNEIYMRLNVCLMYSLN